ncbi:MAG: hypothetical protein ACRDO9_07575, partial [Gaiellales bacterium]
MDADPGDALAPALDLSRVEAGTDVQAERSLAISESERATNGTRRAVEGVDRGENPVGSVGPPGAREELLHLVDDTIDIARPDQVLVAGQLHVLRVRNLCRNP